MFTYISEHHLSVQIQLCPIYNLSYKSSYDNECTMQMPHNTLSLMNESKTAVKSLHGLVSVIIKAKKHCYIKI